MPSTEMASFALELASSSSASTAARASDANVMPVLRNGRFPVGGPKC